MRRTVEGISVVHDGTPLRSSTTLERAGPYTVVLASTVAGDDVELHSTYTGHPAVDSLAVHLELPRRAPARVSTREHPHAALPVSYAHERLVLDHIAQLRELVARAGGGHVAVTVDDTALDDSARGR